MADDIAKSKTTRNEFCYLLSRAQKSTSFGK